MTNVSDCPDADMGNAKMLLNAIALLGMTEINSTLGETATSVRVMLITE